MKTLSGTLKPVIVTAFAILAVLAFDACKTTSSGPGGKFGLEIKETFHLSNPIAFLRVLKTLSTGAFFEFRLDYDNGKSENFRSGSPLNIKTDKVTMFEAPKSPSTGKFTAIGAHVTQRVYSNSISDIQKVLDELKKQKRN